MSARIVSVIGLLFALMAIGQLSSAQSHGALSESLQDVLAKAQNQQILISRVSASIYYEQALDGVPEREKKGRITRYDDNFIDISDHILHFSNDERMSISSSMYNNRSLSYSHHSGQSDHKGRMIRSATPRKVLSANKRNDKAGWLMKSITPSDSRPILDLLGEATEASITLHNNGGGKLYLIEFTVPEGEYKLTIDPDHSYNISAYEYVKDMKAGHFIYSNEQKDLFPGPYAVSLKESGKSYDVKFEDVGGIFLPNEARLEVTETYADHSTAIIQGHVRLSDITLLSTPPDEAVFDVNWPEGTIVYDFSLDEFGEPVTYVVDSNGELLHDTTSNMQKALEGLHIERLGLDVDQDFVSSPSAISSDVKGTPPSVSGGDKEVVESASLGKSGAFILVFLIVLAAPIVLFQLYRRRSPAR